MKRGGLLLLMFTLLVSVTACGNRAEKGTDTLAEPDSQAASIQETPPEEMEEKHSAEGSSMDSKDTAGTGVEDRMETTDITITVDGQVITATLDNSETSREFLATLPRTFTMNEYGGREYYGEIEALSENGNLIDDFENGDVTYFTNTAHIGTGEWRMYRDLRNGTAYGSGRHPRAR